MANRIFISDKLTHSFKTAVACLIGSFIALFFGPKGGQWIVITILVVMCAQIYVGGVVTRSSFRFLGTLIGCTFAIFVIVVFGVTKTSVAIAVSLAGFIFSWVAVTYEMIGLSATLGAVSTAIILLGVDPTVHFAIWRFVEITLGILIATLVSQFILPIHAYSQLRRMQAMALEQISHLYQINMSLAPEEDTTTQDIDENIIKLLMKQRQLAKEATNEPFAHFNAQLFTKTLACEKQMLRAINMMQPALTKLPNAKEILITPEFKQFNDSVLEALNDLVMFIKYHPKAKTHIHKPNLKLISSAITEKMFNYSHEDMVYIEGLIFVIEVFIFHLEKLAVLNQVQIKD